MPAPHFERRQAAEGWPRRERYHPAVMSIWLANIVATMRDDPTSHAELLSDGVYLPPSGSRDAAKTPNKETPVPPRPSRRQEPEPRRAEPWELAWIRR
jgi:hypothetical protein